MGKRRRSPSTSRFHSRVLRTQSERVTQGIDSNKSKRLNVIRVQPGTLEEMRAQLAALKDAEGRMGK